MRLDDAVVPLRELDVAPVLDVIGDASPVLLGEATHGTQEFYATRAAVTRALIAERGFTAVAVEADWPDAYRADRFVRARGDDATPTDALGGFTRFPAWMWRNTEVVRFLAWLREHDAAADAAAGFYGLDLYSLHASIDAVIGYLERVDPAAADRARARYACFDGVRDDDGQRYGLLAAIDRSCEDDVVAQLVEMRARATAPTDGDVEDEEDAFAAEQNARVALSAERYYREMYRAGASSWNLRDTHMADTLGELVGFLSRRGASKVVVWAHNSHVGDARASEMGAGGEHSLGQLVRERWGARACLIGFTTWDGSVTAAASWGAPAERMRVRPALDGSCEAVLHRTGAPRLLVRPADVDELAEPLLERAIGVIYRPRTERRSHYFWSRWAERFDAVIHIDRTSAVEPLERWSRVEEEPPETYPTAV